MTRQNNLLLNQDKNIVEMSTRQNLITFQEFSDKTTAKKYKKKPSKLRKQFPLQHSVGLNPNIAVDFCHDLYLSCCADI